MPYFLISKSVIVEEQMVVEADGLAEAHAMALAPESQEHWFELPARVKWRIDPAVPRDEEVEGLEVVG